MKKVLIAGGGLIGLTTAYYLAEAGHEVIIIDKFNFQKNCSLGNAGLIVPSHFVPLSSPRIIWQGIKWSMNPSSPFSIKFSANPELYKWGAKFWSNCTQNHINKSASVLLNFNLFSKGLYMELEKVIPQINLKNNGLLMLCQNEQKLMEEYALADKALSMGLNIEKLDRDDLNKFQLGTTVDAAGGVYYKTDAHLSPVNLTNGLIKLLKDKKVKMYKNCELLDFVSKNGVLSDVVTNKEVFEFDELVLATGYLSQKLFNKLQIKAKVQPGKGYSFDYQPQAKLNLPAILVDARVAVTPYQNYIRFAGAMEIGGNQDSVKTKKINGMVKAINSFFPDFNVRMPEGKKTWIGLRPCSHDGLPYIGRVPKFKNVVIATAHSMMGVSLAPATAKITEELISGKKLSFNIEPFNPDR